MSPLIYGAMAGHSLGQPIWADAPPRPQVLLCGQGVAGAEALPRPLEDHQLRGSGQMGMVSALNMWSAHTDTHTAARCSHRTGT